MDRLGPAGLSGAGGRRVWRKSLPVLFSLESLARGECFCLVQGFQARQTQIVNISSDGPRCAVVHTAGHCRSSIWCHLV